MDIEFSSRGLLMVLFRQKMRFLFVFLAVMLLGIFYLSTQKPVYEARASLLVKFGREAVPNLVRPDIQGSPDVLSDRQEMTASFVGILRSTDLLRDAVTQFGAEKLYPDIAGTAKDPLEAAVGRLIARDLKPTTEVKSNLISVSLLNGNPVVATDFSSLLIEKFLARQAAIYNPPRTNFLRQQIEDARVKLAASLKTFQAFKNDTKIAALDEEMGQLISEKGSLSGLAFSALTQAQATLADLEAKDAELRATNRPDSLLVRRQGESIAVARQRVRTLQEDLNAATTDKPSALATKIAALDGRIAFLESQRGRYTELERQVKLDEENYKYYQQRGEEARVNDMLNDENITRISVVDTPSTGPDPVAPRKKLILAATLVAALLLALGVALVAELLDDRLTNPRQLTRALGVPVLAIFDRNRKAGLV